MHVTMPLVEHEPEALQPEVDAALAWLAAGQGRRFRQRPNGRGVRYFPLPYSPPR